MYTIKEVKENLDKLLKEKGISYAQASRMIRRNDAYIFQFINNQYPQRLTDIDRQLLAAKLGIDEQLLTDLPLKKPSSPPREIDTNILEQAKLVRIIVEKIEQWLNENEINYSPKDKAKLIEIAYIKFSADQENPANTKIYDFAEHYKIYKKAN